jgi:hypothetical protein
LKLRVEIQEIGFGSFKDASVSATAFEGLGGAMGRPAPEWAEIYRAKRLVFWEEVCNDADGGHVLLSGLNELA